MTEQTALDLNLIRRSVAASRLSGSAARARRSQILALVDECERLRELLEAAR